MIRVEARLSLMVPQETKMEARCVECGQELKM